MAPPLIVTWNRWSDFVKFDAEAIQHGSVLRPSFLFRGQAGEAWTLRPTLARIGREAGWTKERALEIEAGLLRHFIGLAHLYLPPRLVTEPRNLVSWWIAMQHYGAPTRILDWTRSVYVAAYFAVQEQPRAPGAVWIVQGAQVQREMDTKFGALTASDDAAMQASSAPPSLHFPMLDFETDRMAAQQAVFTLSRDVLEDHLSLIESVMPEDPGNPLFIKAIIPAQAKLEFVRRLRHMNITASALFPGIDGIGRSTNELARAAGRMEGE